MDDKMMTNGEAARAILGTVFTVCLLVIMVMGTIKLGTVWF